MDGTLIDSAALVPDAYAAAIIELGGPSLSRADVIDAYPLGPPAVLLSHFLGRASRPADVELYHRHLAARASAGVRPYPGVPALLSVAGRRMPIAVFTGASHVAASILLERAGLFPSLDLVVGGDEVPCPKPAPDGIAEVCRRLGVAATDAAYVGDAPLDMAAATASGGLAIAAGWGHQHDSSVPADLTFATPDELRHALTRARPPCRPTGSSRRPSAPTPAPGP